MCQLGRGGSSRAWGLGLLTFGMWMEGTVGSFEVRCTEDVDGPTFGRRQVEVTRKGKGAMNSLK